MDEPLVATAKSIIARLREAREHSTLKDKGDDEENLSCRSLIPRLKGLPNRTRAAISRQIEQEFFRLNMVGLIMLHTPMNLSSSDQTQIHFMNQGTIFPFPVKEF